ncbi:MAG: hypothetical protein KKB62_02140 [Nanoarchaeota archaeon]|nr:hypothetical protein [Nanoarchaeota archaeon]
MEKILKFNTNKSYENAIKWMNKYFDNSAKNSELIIGGNSLYYKIGGDKIKFSEEKREVLIECANKKVLNFLEKKLNEFNTNKK